jgi:hypothetical protein
MRGYFCFELRGAEFSSIYLKELVLTPCYQLKYTLPMKKLSTLKIALFTIAAATNLFAQQPALTAADYARAEKMLGFNTAPLVDRSGVRPTFLPDGRFYYRVLTPTGSEYVLVNPATGERKTAADEKLLLAGVTVTPKPAAANQDRNAIVSPDGKKAVYIKDWNLWMRELATGKEIQLTVDGVKDFGYATDNAGWTHSDRAIVKWSSRLEENRHVSAGSARGKRYVSGDDERRRAEIEQWKYPLPGDPIITIQRVIIETKLREYSSSDAARPATLDFVRRYFVRRQLYRCRVDAGFGAVRRSFQARAITNKRI